jgi:acetyl-CoA C-acetyltransferase
MRSGARMGDTKMIDLMVAVLTDPFGVGHMGVTAENLAEKWKLTREEQDAFAVESHRRASVAIKEGRFKSQIVPITIKSRKGDVVFDTDEHCKPDTTMETLGKMKAVFKKEGGTVTAGNASGINDGAAALLLVGESTVKKYDLKPLAIVKSMAIAGLDPSIMGVGPVPATQKALQRAGLRTSDLGLVELNEAFASQSIACMRDLALNPEIVNVNGGAIALGHPLGCSGARISATLIHEMQKRKVQYGLATMCIGVGQGAAVVYERVDS